MGATKLETVHSVDEFRLLYYPEDEPELDYFGDTGPHNEIKEDESELVSVDPLDAFARVLTEIE